MPRGLRKAGDEASLEDRDDIDSTYWGGALFAFLADVEIRRATEGRSSLATAIRGVLDAGGDTRVGWTVDRFMSACDGAVGRPILTALYHRLRDRPGHVDLDSMWRQLGVSATPAGIRFDDAAPLAWIRRQMSSRGTASPPPPAIRP
jgi:predicted metalloprotease with PDZ domain